MANLGYEFGFEELKRLNDYNFGDSTTGIGKYNVRRSDVTYDDDTRPVITETGEKLLDFENRFEENLIRKEQLLKEEQITNEQKSDNNNNDDSSDSTEIEYSDPLRKIGGGRVLQYPIDLDTDLQDHFEIQVFKYRPAGTLPAITSTNQGSNAAGTKQLRGGYYSGSNRRGNRQNFRLQDLQSTIQLPIPPSIKDTNTVSFNDSRMSGFSAAIMGPAVAGFLGKNSKFEFPKPEPGLQGIRTRASNLLKGTGEALLNILGAGAEAVTNDEFTRLTQLKKLKRCLEKHIATV